MNYVDPIELKDAVIAHYAKLDEDPKATIANDLTKMIMLIAEGVSHRFAYANIEKEDCVTVALISLVRAINNKLTKPESSPSRMFAYMSTVAINSCRQELFRNNQQARIVNRIFYDNGAGELMD